MPAPQLLGLTNTNRDFSQAVNWGKNIFNNAFPVALACYMHQRQLNPVYLQLSHSLNIEQVFISVENLLGVTPFSANAFYAFERDFAPYQLLMVGNLPRADLVVMDVLTAQSYCALEIKLTALPDNSTVGLADAELGCELVVRPDTIVYIAASIASLFRENRERLADYLAPLKTIHDWTDIAEVAPLIPEIAELLNRLLQDYHIHQKPLVMQPIWKTQGKLLQLHENAFDIFVWSDFAFTRLFFRSADENLGKPSRGGRSVAWLAKMLLDYAQHGKIDHQRVIDHLSYNTKNDKAFAVNGRVTQPFMRSEQLTTPRIRREEIREIILYGGEEYLSPERRLDAAILSTPHLFR